MKSVEVELPIAPVSSIVIVVVVEVVEEEEEAVVVVVAGVVGGAKIKLSVVKRSKSSYRLLR